ncbi:DUF433 domain-containing protein [bacterium]|nr:DUF433 domain-containing protein [bacterium]
MYEELIAIDANVCNGKPCIKGTRILVSSILSQLAAGYNFDEIKAGYLELMDQYILASLEYARTVVEDEYVYLVSVA